MPDPDLINHPLYSSFPEGWTLRSGGSVLFINRAPVKIRPEDYSTITLDVLQIRHNHDIFVSLQEKEEGDFAFVTCKIQSENGKHHIKECYDICLRIENFFTGIRVHD